MADNILQDTFSPFFQGAKDSVSSAGVGTEWIVIIAVVLGIAVMGIVGAFVYFYFWESKKWTISTRVHYENPNINGVSMASQGTPTKRIRFKDGRVVYMYKSAIQGYTISPELLTWTRPREHDVIVTQDKKLFCLIGINSIDAQRKKLNVDIAYPDIEMDRQDLQTHIDSKKFDDPNERFKIIAKVAIYIIVIIGAVVLVILGSKTYLEAKAFDVQRDNLNLETSKYMAESSKNMNTFILILSKVMPDSFRAIDGENLLNQTLGGK